MKVYLFFQQVSSGDMVGDEPCIEKDGKLYNLYAFTPKKKLANRFRETRDMKRFIEKQVSMEDQSEYLQFVSDNRGCLISKFGLLTVDPDKPRVGTNMKAIFIPMTLYEKQCVDDPMTLDDPTVWYKAPHPAVFTIPVIKALKKLEYCRQFKLHDHENMALQSYVATAATTDWSSNEMTRDLLFYAKYYDDVFVPTEDDYTGPDIATDELSIFIDLFKDTLRM